MVVLPVPGPPVSTVVQRRAASPDGGALLLVPVLGEDPQHTGVEDLGVDLGRLPVEAADDVAADLHLLAPVAVEVEQRVVEPEHLQPHQRARGNRGLPGLRLGPGQHLPRIGLVLERDVGDGGEVEAGGALAYGADGQGGGEQHLLVGLLRHRPEAGRDVDVGGTQHVGPVEHREQAGSPQGQPTVVPVVDHGSTTSPDSRSESSSTIAAGGCQAKTPHGWPSTTGVSGPHMPRT